MFNYNDEEIKKYLSELESSKGWEILKYCMNLRRESILERGKKMRINESQIKMWAELDGFDKAVNLLNDLVKRAKLDDIKISVEE